MITSHTCSVNYKYMYLSTENTYSTYFTVEPWKELTNESNISLGPKDWLLLEICFLPDPYAYGTENITNQYLSFQTLDSTAGSLSTTSLSKIGLRGHVLADWTSNSDANIFHQYMLGSSTLPWLPLDPSYWLLGDGTTGSPVYMLISSENYFHTSKGINITYNEDYKENSFVSLGVVDHYNNSFTLNIVNHNFPKDSVAFLMSYSQGGDKYDGNNAISIGDGGIGQIKPNSSSNTTEDIYVSVTAYAWDNTFETQNFYLGPYKVNLYNVPTWISDKPVLQHAYQASQNNSALIEPPLNNEWRYIWDIQATNEISKICGFVIRLYKNNTVVYLMSESPISYREYLVWDFDKGLCYIDGNQSLGSYSICGVPGRFGVDETFELDGKNYGSFYFYPTEISTDSILGLNSFNTGDKIKISVQPYTRYDTKNDDGTISTNTGAILLGEEVFSDEYAIGLTHKNTIKIKTSENTFETCEVLVKTIEGWKAALEVNVKTADGWKASIE